jgi:hypothetical protein
MQKQKIDICESIRHDVHQCVNKASSIYERIAFVCVESLSINQKEIMKKTTQNVTDLVELLNKIREKIIELERGFENE